MDRAPQRAGDVDVVEARLARRRILSPSPGGGGSRTAGARVGCAAMQALAARLRALSPQPVALRVADAPRRRSLRKRTAAEGRLSTFPLQGMVKTGEPAEENFHDSRPA